MNNLEWLHSLEPKELTEWFAAEHVDTRAERTCRMVNTRGYLCCSECERALAPFNNYCPNCGAKVVE